MLLGESASRAAELLRTLTEKQVGAGVCGM